MTNAVAAAARASTAITAAATPLPHARSAYVHVPFCRQKCKYCDFTVRAVGDSPNPAVAPFMRAYVDTLCAEIRGAAAQRRRRGQTHTAQLQTVYIGGGTPSLLPTAELGRVLDELSRSLGVASGAEVTIEADPATFTAETLQELAALGVNRLSVGAQVRDPPRQQPASQPANPVALRLATARLIALELMGFAAVCRDTASICRHFKMSCCMPRVAATMPRTCAQRYGPSAQGPRCWQRTGAWTCCSGCRTSGCVTGTQAWRRPAPSRRHTCMYPVRRVRVTLQLPPSQSWHGWLPACLSTSTTVDGFRAAALNQL